MTISIRKVGECDYCQRGGFVYQVGSHSPVYLCERCYMKDL